MRSLRKLVSSGARREKGATLVEYALILAVVVVGAIGGIRYLATQSADEVADQADCVSTRPPPPSCIRPIVATTTTVVAPTTTETTQAPTTTTTTTTPPTTEPPTTEPPTTVTPTTVGPTTTTAPPGFPGTGSWDGDDTEGSYSRHNLVAWWGTARVQIRDARGQRLGNAVVVIRWEVTNPAGGASGTVTCTTTSSGSSSSRGECAVRVPPEGQNLLPASSEMRLTIVTVNNLAAPAGTPPLDLDRPPLRNN